jgi:hypothetical protein
MCIHDLEHVKQIQYVYEYKYITSVKSITWWSL